MADSGLVEVSRDWQYRGFRTPICADLRVQEQNVVQAVVAGESVPDIDRLARALRHSDHGLNAIEPPKGGSIGSLEGRE